MTYSGKKKNAIYHEGGYTDSNPEVPEPSGNRSNAFPRIPTKPVAPQEAHSCDDSIYTSLGYLYKTNKAGQQRCPYRIFLKKKPDFSPTPKL